MSEAALDPYAVLGVAPEVSDLELRRVYRDLVKRHHPDHNGGSADSARRFAQIQNAYALIAKHRQRPRGASEGTGPEAAPAPSDPLADRIASMERELAAAREAQRRQAQEREAQETARRLREQAAKRDASQRFQAVQAQRAHSTPEQLGYYSTDDSFTKIIDDATEQVTERLRKSDAKRQFSRRLSDLFGRDA